MCTQKSSSSSSAGLNRRDLLKNAAQYSVLAGAASMLGSKAFALPSTPGANSDPSNPHYFLQINIPGGMDASYLFDARPLDMTKNNLLANYHGKDPILYQGTNGETTYRTSLTDPLMKYQSLFSVVNGVVMSPSLVGHDQLMNVLMTGNPFGGDSFLPWTTNKKLPLDYLTTGPMLFSQINNGEGSMQLDPMACKQLAAKMQKIANNQSITNFIRSRTEALGQGKTSLAASSRRMAGSVGALGDLAAKLSQVQIPENDTSGISDKKERFLKDIHSNTIMLSEFMRNGLTNAGVLLLFDNIDSHDHDTASKLPATLGMYCEAIASVFAYFDSVSMPSGGSLLDHTTFLIGSEFSRTMRQPGVAIDKTGTDHNPLTNSLIVGGKGVKGGQVIGQSDFSSPTETLSPAHLSADPTKLMIMGRPFDFAAGRTMTGALPQTFDVTQYIGASNVTNTIQEILGIAPERRLLMGRNMPAAVSLKGLIA